MDHSRGPGRKTRLSIRDARAAIVHGELLEQLDRFLTTQDVRRLPRFSRWPGEVLGMALCDLACMGLIEEDAHGRLIVLHTEAAA